jgi:hypothetical protein
VLVNHCAPPKGVSLDQLIDDDIEVLPDVVRLGAKSSGALPGAG